MSVAVLSMTKPRMFVKGGGTFGVSAAPSGGIVAGVARNMGIVGGASLNGTLQLDSTTGTVTSEYRKNGGAWTGFGGGEAVSFADNDTMEFRGTGMVAGESYTATLQYNPAVGSAVTVQQLTITAV